MVAWIKVATLVKDCCMVTCMVSLVKPHGCMVAVAHALRCPMHLIGRPACSTLADNVVPNKGCGDDPLWNCNEVGSLM